MSTVRPHVNVWRRRAGTAQTRVIAPNAHAWTILGLLTWLPYEASKLSCLFFIYEVATRWILRVWRRQVSSLLLSYSTQLYTYNTFPTCNSLVLSRMPRVLCCLLCSCVPLCTRCCVRTHCTVVYSAYTYTHV